MAEKTLEQLFEEFKKIPDWQNYPLPEVFYQKFQLPKPKPNSDLMSALYSQLSPPPHEGLGYEVREKAPGGVREIQLPEIPLIRYEPAEPAESTNRIADEHQSEKKQD